MNGHIKTEIIGARTSAEWPAALKRVTELLRAGEVVALPTETVYGLAANALDERAVARIYEAKGRPAHNPIIVHVADIQMARRCARTWPDGADRLGAAFWPGPLTLVLPRSSVIPSIITAQGDTVGIRWPAHPFIQEVIRTCGFPLAAPSANLSNRISPTTAEHVRRSLGGRIPLIVDGGTSEVGIESTVLDLSQSSPVILRPGMIHEESLRAVLGIRAAPLLSPGKFEGSLRSPGLLTKHYAPRASLLLRTWKDDQDLRRLLEQAGVDPARVQVLAHTRMPGAIGLAGVSMMPRQAAAFARALYAELHRCDDAGTACIVVEMPPGSPAWGGIADRLRRAAS